MRFQTTTSCRIQIVSLILAGLISMPAHAEVIPVRWEKVAALEMASVITVELKNGDRLKGQFRSLSASNLDLLSAAGWAVIPKSEIQAITASSKDGLGDGAWKGAAIGTSAFIGSTVISLARGNTSGSDLGLALIGGALCAGIGAGIGIAADAATKTGDIVLYKAPRTPLSPKHRDSGGQSGNELRGHRPPVPLR